MPEFDFVPLFRTMALITFHAKTPGMAIIRLVARKTFFFDFNHIWVFPVAIAALQFFVPPFQRKLGFLVVVKLQAAPAS